MSTVEKSKIFGKFWDSLETSEKIIFTGILFTLTAIAFSFGYAFNNKLNESKFDALQAKHDREINKIQISLESSKSHEMVLSIIPPEKGLPKLAEADNNQLSMAEFDKTQSQFNNDIKSKTSINISRFVEHYVGQRFVWSGYVSDVRKAVFDYNPYYAVNVRTDRVDKYSFSTSCYFTGEQYEELLKDLKTNEKITLTGVMNSEGNLTQCKLVRIGRLLGSTLNKK